MTAPVTQIVVILAILIIAMWVGGVFALRKEKEDNNNDRC